MTEIVTQAPTARQAAFLTMAAPQLLQACEAAMDVLCAVQALPGLPAHLRPEIAKAVARAGEARHLAKHGRINPPAIRALIKEDA